MEKYPGIDEDLHVENVGGNVAMVELADNLKEERSQSLSASADIYHRFAKRFF